MRGTSLARDLARPAGIAGGNGAHRGALGERGAHGHVGGARDRGSDAGNDDDDAMRVRFRFAQTLPKTDKPKYTRPTVMLIDERALSQAEHTGLFFEVANGTKFVGSQTGGANGDVTSVCLPAAICVSFSGHDVRHADGRQLQRVGLVPDVPAKSTLAGIRAGKDEVLERALTWLKDGWDACQCVVSGPSP